MSNAALARRAAQALKNWPKPVGRNGTFHEQLEMRFENLVGSEKKPNARPTQQSLDQADELIKSMHHYGTSPLLAKYPLTPAGPIMHKLPKQEVYVLLQDESMAILEKPTSWRFVMVDFLTSIANVFKASDKPTSAPKQ